MADKIKPGEPKLVNVRGKSLVAAPRPRLVQLADVPAAEKHRVKVCETLTKIAAELKVSLNELKALNPLLTTPERGYGDKILPQDEVRIPKTAWVGKAPVEPTPVSEAEAKQVGNDFSKERVQGYISQLSGALDPTQDVEIVFTPPQLATLELDLKRAADGDPPPPNVDTALRLLGEVKELVRGQTSETGAAGGTDEAQATEADDPFALLRQEHQGYNARLLFGSATEEGFEFFAEKKAEADEMVEALAAVEFQGSEAFAQALRAPNTIDLEQGPVAEGEDHVPSVQAQATAGTPAVQATARPNTAPVVQNPLAGLSGIDAYIVQARVNFGVMKALADKGNQEKLQSATPEQKQAALRNLAAKLQAQEVLNLKDPAKQGGFDELRGRISEQINNSMLPPPPPVAQPAPAPVLSPSQEQVLPAIASPAPLPGSQPPPPTAASPAILPRAQPPSVQPTAAPPLSQNPQATAGPRLPGSAVRQALPPQGAFPTLNEQIADEQARLYARGSMGPGMVMPGFRNYNSPYVNGQLMAMMGQPFNRAFGPRSPLAMQAANTYQELLAINQAAGVFDNPALMNTGRANPYGVSNARSRLSGIQAGTWQIGGNFNPQRAYKVLAEFFRNWPPGSQMDGGDYQQLGDAVARLIEERPGSFTRDLRLTRTLRDHFPHILTDETLKDLGIKLD